MLRIRLHKDDREVVEIVQPIAHNQRFILWGTFHIHALDAETVSELEDGENEVYMRIQVGK